MLRGSIYDTIKKIMTSNNDTGVCMYDNLKNYCFYKEIEIVDTNAKWQWNFVHSMSLFIGI